MPLTAREVERRQAVFVLMVDEGLRVLSRQQRTDLRCVTMKSGLSNCFPVIALPLPDSFANCAPCVDSSVLIFAVHREARTLKRGLPKKLLLQSGL